MTLSTASTKIIGIYFGGGEHCDHANLVSLIIQEVMILGIADFGIVFLSLLFLGMFVAWACGIIE